MNYKLLFKLSVLGMLLAFATVYFIPSTIEPFFWAMIFTFNAFIISNKCSEKYFLSGLVLGLLNGGWTLLVHLFLFNDYVANHPEEMTQLGDSPKQMLIISGLVITIFSGIMQGFFTFIISKLNRKA
jgi:hypothetical protein